TDEAGAGGMSRPCSRPGDRSGSSTDPGARPRPRARADDPLLRHPPPRRVHAPGAAGIRALLRALAPLPSPLRRRLVRGRDERLRHRPPRGERAVRLRLRRVPTLARERRALLRPDIRRVPGEDRDERRVGTDRRAAFRRAGAAQGRTAGAIQRASADAWTATCRVRVRGHLGSPRINRARRTPVSIPSARTIANRTAYEVMTMTSRYPGLALPAARARGHGVAFTTTTDVVIEGYPRSGNSLAFASLLAAQSEPI